MPNRLVAATSLYLRQHAGQPLDWWPWCEEALALAREQDRPILLSVGYAACHWCHVMARESFADPAIGALIDAHYVAIKVDRDQRPDIDRTYQLAHQALQRRGGGWPLTAFLDPVDLLPFFIGTYFPPERSHGLPAFREVLAGLARWYRERPDERAEQARTLGPFLQHHGLAEPERGALGEGPLAEAGQRWLRAADPEHGGARGAPKFPRCGELALCIDSADPAARAHARLSLSAMAAGGLQDQVGGGFFRYCVDEAWQLPHFEKMLVDNAQLLPLYAARAAEGDDEARRAATGIASWLLAEMPRAEGGYASALDADSGGREGGYYLWQQDAFRAALPPGEHDWLSRHLGMDGPPGAGPADWHLRVAVPLDEIAAETGQPVGALRERRKALLQGLKLARARRAPPERDDACLALGNGLLLSGLSRAARRLARADWADAAVRLASDLQRLLWRDEGLLSAAPGAGPGQPGFLDDHAALLVGLLDLLECRFDCEWVDWAEKIAQQMMERFEDPDFGGFWFTAHDAEALPRREKPFLCEATPSGNGLAAQGLLRLGALLAEPRYLRSAERALRAGWPLLRQQAEGAPAMLIALRELCRPTPLLIARLGEISEHERWNEVLGVAEGCGLHVLRVASEASLLPEALEDKRWLRGGRVYWCEGTRCLPRFDSPVALQARLASLG
ncbi:thioredoxin domain-containing protein [Pseudomarimonas salicorniae]|uniref:DUF255 domain-containing protein n=1 Tax=Pseudomarimonas salicorniae TaxID=2933270 RepID=A0ABT0GI94_9GAMM|nr:DUF255 domain-containing protein [Lysobacter sp. CAU 1642]MCK7594077.1 DUF255 domain-containing protein [Lysobacter sp. CAU 1642]